MPVFLGLPVLARFIGWLAGALIAYVAKFFTLGIARIALAISLFLGLIIGLNGLLVSYLSDLTSVLPPEIASAVFMLFRLMLRRVCMRFFLLKQQFLF
jgi:hypothetical protein